MILNHTKNLHSDIFVHIAFYHILNKPLIITFFFVLSTHIQYCKYKRISPLKYNAINTNFIDQIQHLT